MSTDATLNQLHRGVDRVWRSISKLRVDTGSGLLTWRQSQQQVAEPLLNVIVSLSLGIEGSAFSLALSCLISECLVTSS